MESLTKLGKALLECPRLGKGHPLFGSDAILNFANDLAPWLLKADNDTLDALYRYLFTEKDKQTSEHVRFLLRDEELAIDAFEGLKLYIMENKLKPNKTLDDFFSKKIAKIKLPDCV